MDFWSTLLGTILAFLSFFVFVVYLMAVFAVISDLIRDRQLNGFAKAVWIFCLIFVPLITALAYFIVRGDGMAERNTAHQRATQAVADDYIRSVAITAPTDQIVKAKELLDSGTISQDEFDRIKSAALSSID